MDDIKDAFYLYSGTNVCNNSYYKQINLNSINDCLCFYAHEDSEIYISLLSGATYYSDTNEYNYIYESSILKFNSQGYDNQYINNYTVSDTPVGKFIKKFYLPSSSNNHITLKISCGDRIYLWLNNTYNSEYNRINITGKGKYSVSGKLISIINNITPLPNGAFKGLFKNNTALYDASGLIMADLTTLPEDCYYEMFRGCTQLRYPPKLINNLQSNITVSDSCFAFMFGDCTNLIVTPDIPLNVTLSSSSVESVFQGMFLNCTSITSAPEYLPEFNSTAGNLIYGGMFSGCTNLIVGPKEINYSGENGCSQMFYNCTNLKRAPKLPSLNLNINCYEYMFGNCTSLEEAPELPALELIDCCYNGMFAGCSALKYIKADFLYNYDFDDNCCTTDWVNGVASEGIFYKNADGFFAETGSSSIPTDWQVRTEFPISDGLILWLDGYQVHRSTSSTNNWYQSICVPSLKSGWNIRFATTATTPCNGKCMKITGLNGGAHVQYASTSLTSDNPFNGIDMGSGVTSMTYEMFIKLDANQTESSDPNSSLRIGGMTYSTGPSMHRWTYNIDGGGRPYIYSPLDGTTWTDILHATKSVADGRYHHLVFQKDGTTLKFYIDGKLDKIAENTQFIIIPNLGSFLVGIGRYDGLHVTGTTTVRSHPGKYYSLSIYNRALSEDEIKLNYQILNDRYNESYDYNYFYFENLGDSNNYISFFKTGNFTGPSLEYSYDKHTWTSWNYASAGVGFNSYKKIYFRGTNTYIGYDSGSYMRFSSGQNVNVGGNLLSLVSTDLETLPTTRTYMFFSLFRNMTKLISAEDLHMPPPLYNYCYSHMFMGCSNLIKPPKLWSSGTYVGYSYNNMFYNCTSLKYAPTLWNKTIGNYCYNYMFYGCTSLRYIKALFSTSPGSSSTANWVANVNTSSGVFVKQTNASWTVTGNNGAPTNWTIVKVDY